MALTLTLTCPVCDAPIGTRTLTMRGTQGDIDGNFQRDPGQHVHYENQAAPTCVNGHRFRIRVEVLAERIQ